MTAADRSPNGVYHDQGTPRQLGGATDAAFKQIDALTFIRLSSQLDPNDGVMIDISPATRGNTPNAPFTESYDQVGYAVNPFTDQPYTPQMVKHGDFGRVVAEFWADGPRSTAPPGHWNEIANDVTDKMDALGIPKRIGGTGPVVSDLEWDVKKYFALNGGMHDAAIAAWNHKGVYDSARPISFIRYMGQLGQSSDPNLMVDLGGGNHGEHVSPRRPAAGAGAGGSHHAADDGGRASGTSISPATRARSPSARGRGPSTAPRRSTTRRKSAASTGLPPKTWMPYQLLGFVTPPFAGYVSGHSTYSRTGAEVLTLFTGSEFFPGGIFEYDIPMGSGLDFEYGPTTPMKLQFATYFDASDQASISRIYGGIHPPADDFPGRRIGNMVGPDAFASGDAVICRGA